MRLTLFSILLLVAGILGCTDAQPCSNCPPIDGTYAVNWGQPDAGSSTTRLDGGACAITGPDVTSWTLAQKGAQVTTTIANINMGGTLYDTFDLTMSGSESTLSYRMHALAIPGGTAADAGMQLQGTFTTRTLSDDPCEISEAFTAQRISR